MSGAPPSPTLEPNVSSRVRKPHPRLAQAKRTWYFFRRNTLAMVGLGILITLAAIAGYAAAQKLPWTSLPCYASGDYGPATPSTGYPGNYVPTASPCVIVCTYEKTPPPNAAQYCSGQWYKTPFDGAGGVNDSFGGVIAPTIRFSPFSTGPLPLGDLTENVARDSPEYSVLGAIERGADWSLIFSVSIVALGALIGLFVGAVAGFFGGIVDDVLMRLVDIFLSIPIILFVIVVVTVTLTIVPGIHGSAGANLQLFMLIVAFVIVWWPVYARIVRGQVLVVREQKYVEAARASGASKGRILMRHIIPNSMYPVFIQFSLDVGTIPLLIGSLVFLGFGPTLFPGANTTPFPEWGSISAASTVDLTEGMLGSCYGGGPCVIAWWQLFFPGLALFLFAISVNLLSDGIRDALDPRLRR